MSYQKILRQNPARGVFYKSFQGVDLSGKNPSPRRFEHVSNMFKDPSAGDSASIETVPGYRRKFAAPNGSEIFGVHVASAWRGAPFVLVHAGDALYEWRTGPGSTSGITMHTEVVLPAPVSVDAGTGIKTFAVAVDDAVYAIDGLAHDRTPLINDRDVFSLSNHVLTVHSSTLEEGDVLDMAYHEVDPRPYTRTGGLHFDHALVYGVSERRSVSFAISGSLYILDGDRILAVAESDRAATWPQIHEVSAYIPTTFINITPGGEHADAGTAYEPRNMLQPKFRHTYIADGATRIYRANEAQLDTASPIVTLNGETYAGRFTYNGVSGTLTFDEAPPAPSAEGTANVAIVWQKGGAETDITHCTMAEIYDNRVFLTGNPDCPNRVFWCRRSAETGNIDPTYFSVLDHLDLGKTAHVTGMRGFGGSLAVFSHESEEAASYISIYAPQETGADLLPACYVLTEKFAAPGCLGPSITFDGRLIYLSTLGVEALGARTAGMERRVEHCSALLGPNPFPPDCLSKASVASWQNYLIVSVGDGRIYLGDRLQKWRDAAGDTQFEWYCLRDIGIWDGQYDEFRFCSYLPDDPPTVSVCMACLRSVEEHDAMGSLGEHDAEDPHDLPLVVADALQESLDFPGETRDLRGQVANPPNDDGEASRVVTWSHEFLHAGDDDRDRALVHWTAMHVAAGYDDVCTRLGDDPGGWVALACEPTGAKIGGRFHPATIVGNVGGNLFFATDNGLICQFNFDMREDKGGFPREAYQFDGRTIVSCCATHPDDCGFPGLTKTTVRGSVVVKARASPASALKIAIATDRHPFRYSGRYNAGRFRFDDVNFRDFSFSTTDTNLLIIDEQERRWTEKQFLFYSDEYQKPIALFHAAYRYRINGLYRA